MHFHHRDSKNVTSKDAVEFKRWMGSDKADFLRSKPGHPMFYDTDFVYLKDRDFWLKVLLGMMFTNYAY